MLNLIKGGGWVVIVLGLLGVVVARELKQAEQRGRLRELAAQLDSVYQAWASDTAANNAEARRQDSVIAVLQNELAMQQRTNRTWRNRAADAGRRLDDLLATLPDTTARSQIEAQVAVLQRSNRECQSALALCEAVNDTMSVRLTTLGRQYLEAQHLIERQRVVIDSYEAIPHGFDWLPWGIAAGAVAVAVSVIAF